MVGSFQDYYQLLLLTLLAIVISLPFRFIVIHFINQSEKNVKNIVPFLSWIKKSGKIRVLNLIFDFFYVALAFVIIWNFQNLVISTVKIIFIAILISLGLIDWFIYRLPNLLLIFGFVITILLLFINSAMYVNYIYGATIGLVIGFGIRLLGKMYYKKEVFGIGDIKLLMLMGLFAGWQYFFPIFFIGMFMASIYSLIEIIFKRLDWKSKIPLGSFFCFALILFQIIDQKYLDFIYQIS